jgi:hypothetical protein
MTSKINSTIFFVTKVIQVSAIDLGIAGQERTVIKEICGSVYYGLLG